MFGKESPEQKQRRHEGLVQGWLQQTSVALADYLHSEGFLNYSVSIYPDYPIYAMPEIAKRHVEQFLYGLRGHLNFGSGWLVHVSFIMEKGVARASYERQDGSYWCAEDYLPA